VSRARVCVCVCVHAKHRAEIMRGEWMVVHLNQKRKTQTNKHVGYKRK
jgi:hypothetical protein